MTITIFTYDRCLASDLKKDAPFDFTTSITSKGAKSFGESSLYEIAIQVAELGKSIATGVFSNWLFDKIKNRAKGVSVEGKQASVDETEIRCCIEIKIKKTHSRKLLK